ncbi:hypothetical protein G7Z17_g1547 [Cylindrodendrum hubeiense]|uniref:Uncharacterized protein n=1 Tax=Cylindrodendrum hubeiense TaxID=595255 RepID=A0A9P5HJI4_9HYPO|nr:hypothetical protein G7Z17_g1547 [Cylindrodendrum hubeiense]
MQAPRHSSEKTSLRQDCLRTLVQAMNEYHLQYHGVDLISHTIHHVVDLAQLDPALRSTGARMGWSDVISHRPVQYLRLTLIMDLTLTHAKLPEKYEFPSNLQRLLSDQMGTAAFLPWNVPSPADEPDTSEPASLEKDTVPNQVEPSESLDARNVPAMTESTSANENEVYSDSPSSDDFLFELSTQLSTEATANLPIPASVLEDQGPPGEDNVDWDVLGTDGALDAIDGVSHLVPTVEGNQVEEFVSMLFEMAEAQDEDLFRLEEQASPSQQWPAPSSLEMPS